MKNKKTHGPVYTDQEVKAAIDRWFAKGWDDLKMLEQPKEGEVVPLRLGAPTKEPHG